MIDKEKFRKRYFQFWCHFHQDRKPPDHLKAASDSYRQLLERKKITYEKFDEICTSLQIEQECLPATFNLVAYCIDWAQSEYHEQMMQQASNDKKPIRLPQQGEPIRLINNPRIQGALERIKKSNPKLLEILERINIHRIKTPHRVCASCGNTGYVFFGGTYDEEREIIEPMKDEKKYDYSIVKRCRCAKGEELNKSCKLATSYECEEAARINSGHYKQSPF